LTNARFSEISAVHALQIDALFIDTLFIDKRRTAIRRNFASSELTLGRKEGR